MKRTDKQLDTAILRMFNKHGRQTEKYYTALMNYWLRYDLTSEQCIKLESAKNN